MDSRKKRPAAKLKRKPSPRLPAPTSCELIVLTGLVHMEAGESLGRELAFCTAHQNSDAFFLGPEDMATPDGYADQAARCCHCKEGETGEAETHWVVDFRTAVFEGVVNTQEAGIIIEPASLLKNLADCHGTGPVAKRAGVLKAATS